MAGGIDTSKRKPRQARGTPAYKIRNYVGLVGVAIGTLIGSIFYFTTSDDTRKKWDKLFFTPTEEELERKLRMRILPMTPSKVVKEAIEEEQNA